MRRWYQTLDIDGVTFEDPGRKYSAFWNEGKWDNFIKPLLPKERQTFIEIGCNAGLFLKMATDEGFKNVIGVERDRQIFGQAQTFKNSIRGTYKLVHQQIGDNFEPEQLPVADVILLSNVHYYFPIGVFSKLVDTLRGRCSHCIIVSAQAKRAKGNAFYDRDVVRGYFRDWQEEKIIEDLKIEDDPSPRKYMYGLSFKGSLVPIRMEEIYGHFWEASKSVESRSYELAPAAKEFFELVLSNTPFNYEETLFYEYWMKREPKRMTPEKTRDWLIYKAELAKDIQKNGMKEPIYISSRGKFMDGLHRLIIANLLGYEHILARTI